MERNKLDNIEIYQKASAVERIGNRAISKALKELREKGIPIVFSRNGTIYYECKDGKITRKRPKEFK